MYREISYGACEVGEIGLEWVARMLTRVRYLSKTGNVVVYGMCRYIGTRTRLEGPTVAINKRCLCRSKTVHIVQKSGRDWYVGSRSILGKLWSFVVPHLLHREESSQMGTSLAFDKMRRWWQTVCGSWRVLGVLCIVWYKRRKSVGVAAKST